MTEHSVLVKEIEKPGLKWSCGAPIPFLMSSDYRTLFAYNGWGEEDHLVFVAEIIDRVSIQFGFPNDEALHGHPLSEKGLRVDRVFEIENSPWIEALEKIERAHPKSTEFPFEGMKHFVLSFHDSTMETVASDIQVLKKFDSYKSAIEFMTEQIENL